MAALGSISGPRCAQARGPCGHRQCETRPLSPHPVSVADQLEGAADQAIAACGGDARKAVKALIVATHFLKPIWRSYGLCARKLA